MDYTFFSIFSIDILVNFLTEYKDVGETQPCRDLSKIAIHYFNSGFFLDFVSWLPIHYMPFFFNNHRQNKWILAIKAIRIYKAFKLFDILHIMKYVRSYYYDRTFKKIEKNP